MEDAMRQHEKQMAREKGLVRDEGSGANDDRKDMAVEERESKEKDRDEDMGDAVGVSVDTQAISFNDAMKQVTRASPCCWPRWLAWR
jgi:hypothetical protein